MEEDSLLDEECLALESILEDKFTRLQPDRIRLIIAPEGAEEGSAGMVIEALIMPTRKADTSGAVFAIAGSRLTVYLAKHLTRCRLGATVPRAYCAS